MGIGANHLLQSPERLIAALFLLTCMWEHIVAGLLPCKLSQTALSGAVRQLTMDGDRLL